MTSGVSSSDVRLLEAEAILKYCCVTEDQLERKKRDCREGLFKLRRLGSPGTTATATATRLINDAIHGPIEISPLIHKIINTPEFHRLKEIKQLGGANYVYPGANHTRFDHSLGVFYLAGEFARHLQKNAQLDFPDERDLFTDKHVVCTQIAGLCHDLGHGPLSHLFERYVMDLKHEDLSVKVFRELMVENPSVLAQFVDMKCELGFEEFKLIELMIKPPKRGEKLPTTLEKREFLCEIVANNVTGVDVDKWDYYARDCHYLGVTSDFQERRCMLLGRIGKNEAGEFHVAFRDKELDNIYGMFRTRAILHQKAYQHKTVKAVEKMIADAIQSVYYLPLMEVLGSDSPFSIHEAVDKAAKGHVKSYLALTDSIIGVIKCCPLSLVSKEADKKKLMDAKELLKRIEARDLYHCSWKVRIPKKMSQTGEDKLWRQLMSLSKQPEGESINEFLEPETRKEAIKEIHLWVPIERIQLPSEEAKNPVDDILFYKKSLNDGEPIELLKKEEVKEMASMLVVPQAFVECEVRVYDKRKACERAVDDQEALKNALLKWRRNAEEKYNGGSHDHS